MAFDLIQMPCKHLLNKEDQFGWRLLVFTINGVKKTTVIVGRHSSADFRIDPPDLPCFVSRKHARFDVKENKLYIQDLGSTNGTYRNNIMLSPNMQYLLNNGDLVAFGCNSEKKPSPGDKVIQQNTPFLFRVLETSSVTNSPAGKNVSSEKVKHNNGSFRRELVSQNSHDEDDSGFGDTDSHCSSKKQRLMSSEITAMRLGSVSPNNHVEHDHLHSSSHEIMHRNSHDHTGGSTSDNDSGRKRKYSLVKSTRKQTTSCQPRARKRLNTKPHPFSKRADDGEKSFMERCASFECKISDIDSEDLISWVQCDSCDKWFHTMCVGCNYDDVRHRTQRFHCGFCIVDEAE